MTQSPLFPSTHSLRTYQERKNAMNNNAKVIIKEVSLAAVVFGAVGTAIYANRQLNQSLKESGHDKVVSEYIARINQLYDTSRNSLSTNLLSDYDR